MNSYDLIIIGGGAAGIMAAISAKKSQPDKSVLIIDRTFALGRKILVCGAGRCNITNQKLKTGYQGHYYGSPERFIGAVFNQFGFNSIVEFFNDLGVELYLERKTDIGKMFPITNQAKTITAMLEDELEQLGVEVILNSECTRIKVNEDGIFLINVNHLRDKASSEYKSDFLIMATGGKTYPALGSDGSGYDLVSSFGHKIIAPVPSAVPIESKNKLSHALQGVRMEVEATSIIDGQARKTRTNELMFTKYGFSGPVILDISREFSIYFNREKRETAIVKFNFLPGYDSNQVLNLFKDRWRKRPEQTLEKSMYGLFPNKFPIEFINIMVDRRARIDPGTKVNSLSDDQIKTFIEALTNSNFPVTGTRGWNEGEFSAGGIETKQVKVGTLESKIVQNLYFCGEILNVDGDVGGYNLSWSWSSGHVAGKLA